jgi:hypothetical protein
MGESEQSKPEETNKTDIQFGDHTRVEGDLVAGDKVEIDASGIQAGDGAQVNIAGGDLIQRTEIRIEAGATVVIGQQAGAGLEALNDFIQVSPVIRQAASEFRTTFEAALAQVDVMGDYKDLHDLLHQTQFHCFEPIVAESTRFPDETTLDMLDSYNRNLRDIYGRLQEIANRKRVSEADINWFQDMQQAQNDLRSAIDTTSADALKKGIWRLRRILGQPPVIINKGLVDAARTLRLPVLIAALQSLGSQMQSLKLDETKTATFTEGLRAAEKMSAGLELLLKEHDLWQIVDGEIRRVDSLIERDLMELEMSWDDIKQRTSPLYTGIEAEWAVMIQTTITTLDEALPAGNPPRTRRAFKAFRREANSRFYQVDHDLKTLCGSLRQIGGPLNAILRSYA